MYLRVCAPREVKLPPTRILPSVCNAKLDTVLLATGLNVVSCVLSPFTRPTYMQVCPHNVVNDPPTRVLPSGWEIRQYTVLFADELKLLSSVPSKLSRPM